ncbi:MAG TPA: TetR/AcrR family transcriptional regulator [Propionibacteriaceae bacterium]
MRAKPMSPEDRRQAIISATTDLVLEHGPAATTRQIADACGIAEGTLFRVFESKDDILAAVVEQLLDPKFLIDDIEAISAEDNVVDTVRALVAVVDAAAKRVRSVMMALHTAQDAMDRRRNHHGPGDKNRFIEGQAAVVTAMAGVLSPYADDLRVDPESAASFIQITVFASSLPSGTKFRASSIFTDLLVHALVKEPACPVTQ